MGSPAVAETATATAVDASNPHDGRPHIHAYRWTGDRRTYDQEGPTPTRVTFATTPRTPILIANWLLRPAIAITGTFHHVDDAVRWFEARVGLPSGRGSRATACGHASRAGGGWVSR